MTWTPVVDEDGNPIVPDTERSVLVFLSGDRGIDAPRNNDQGWGLRLGYFDHEKGYWRVHGRPEKYVTHWMNEPDDPETARTGAVEISSEG